MFSRPHSISVHFRASKRHSPYDCATVSWYVAIVKINLSFKYYGIFVNTGLIAKCFHSHGKEVLAGSGGQCYTKSRQQIIPKKEMHPLITLMVSIMVSSIMDGLYISYKL